MSAANELAAAGLKAVMLKRGISHWLLAELCGVDCGSVWNEFNRGFAGEVLKYRIERVLDFPPGLWSGAADVDFRKRCIREFGGDPRDMDLVELKALCRRVGTGSPALRRHDAWYALLMKFSKANPEHNKQTSKVEGVK